MKLKHFIYLFLYLISILTFTPEIIELELKIKQLQTRSHKLRQYRYQEKNVKQKFSQQMLPKYTSSQIIFNAKCQFQGKLLQSFTFQTAQQIYFAINDYSQNIVIVYNSQCDQLSILQHVQIESIISDRGISQTGVVYFISKDKAIYHFYEENRFHNALRLVSLEQKQSIVGGIVRYRGEDRVQIFIAFKNGAIEVFDESGVSKLRLFLQGNDPEISLFADHHPYPLIVSKSDWLSMLDTNKYIQISQNCPHIPHVKSILSENFYGQTIYLITQSKIFVLSLQVNKKQCTIKREYDLKITLSHINKASYFSNTLFLDKKVFNMTQRQLYIRHDNSSQSSYEFVSKRNQHDQDYCLSRICKGEECRVEINEAKRPDKDKSIFLWLIVGFIIVIFVSLSLMKKTNRPNLELDERFAEEKIISEDRVNELYQKNRQKNFKQKKK